MIWLPKNVIALAKLCAKDPGRYHLTGIKVSECKEAHNHEWYRLEATDGKVLGIVCGISEPCSLAAGQSIDMQAALAAPNCAVEFLMGAKHFDDLLKPLKNGQKVIVLADDKDVTGFGPGVVSKQPRPEGRFPNTDAVLPRTPPLLTFRVNPHNLVRVVNLVCSIMKGENDEIEMLYFGPGKPLGIIARGDPATGQTFDGLVMPLYAEPQKKEPPKPAPVKVEEEADEDDPEEPGEPQEPGDPDTNEPLEGDDTVFVQLSYQCWSCHHQWDSVVNDREFDLREALNGNKETCPACRQEDVGYNEMETVDVEEGAEETQIETPDVA